MGAEPTNGKGSGKLHARVSKKDNGETTTERVGGGGDDITPPWRGP